MKRVASVTFVLFLLVLLAGCKTAAMKGTPFYTGEYTVRQGPVEDRVNIWPLLYYRDPALSVLWPVLEKTEDHFALRPVYSLYGLDTGEHVHNVLWPIGQFDSETGRNRFFPFFWSGKRDSFYIFPLYGHSGDPFGEKGGNNYLFPLWIIDRDAGGYSNHFLWPFIKFGKRESPPVKDWRIWPLAGHNETKHFSTSYYLWPLGWNWSYERSNEKGNAILPLYLYQSDNKGESFFSLPYSFGSSLDDDSYWKCSVPLFYHSKSADGSTFMSLPYWRGSSIKDDEEWSLLAPFYYTKREEEDRLLVTLLGGYKRENNSSSWVALPILSGGRKGPDGSDKWILGPLAHFGRSGDARSSHLFPMYYSSKDEDSSLFISLPWTSSQSKDVSWRLVPLFYFGMRDESGSKLITPVYASGLNADNERWRAIMPLYYRNKASGTFASSLYVRFGNELDETTTIIPPLLSWHTGGEDRSDLWLAGPFAHWSWGDKAAAKHVLPLFYSDGEKNNFLSLGYTSWRSDDGVVTRSIPPLLSWLRSEDETSDLWVVGPMAHWSWGKNAEKRHIIPLFYSDSSKEMMVSPLWARWKDEDDTNTAIPPLLSWYTSDGKDKEVNGLLGVFNQGWGQSGKKGQLLPLYLYRGGEEVYTPLFGWNSSEDTKYFYPLTPLLGFWRGDNSGWWLQPLGSYKRSKKTGKVKGNFLWGTYSSSDKYGDSSIFPIYSYTRHGDLDDIPEVLSDKHAYKRYGKKFFCLPIVWYRNQVIIKPDYRKDESGKFQKTGKYIKRHEKKHGVFPLWSSSLSEVQEDKMLDAEHSLLWLLYDYKREVRKLEDDPDDTNEYVRRRILWRFWHYERLNEEVSVDLFPAITYDRKADGFKRISFLWRFFRYEREVDGNKKLDLLFLPIMR